VSFSFLEERCGVVPPLDAASWLRVMSASDTVAQRLDAMSEQVDAETSRKLELQRRTKDRQERATVEQVLDRRTRAYLAKLFRQGALLAVHGCIATGKEANVYFGRSHPPNEPESVVVSAAIKVYKTSILIFRDREKYIAGERRFRYGYGKPRNPRKMVKLWAEKEFRNLSRLCRANIPCPSPFYIRGHVLVMQFIGDEEGTPAPRLQEVRARRRAPSLSAEGASRGEEGVSSAPETMTEAATTPAESLYEQTVINMRRMYQKARLVHGDLSSFNILLWQGRIYFVDVSQSMEQDHPLALDFLRRDCQNITAFFQAEMGNAEANEGMILLSVRNLFEYIVDVWDDVDDIALLQKYQTRQEEQRRRRVSRRAQHADDELLSDDSTDALVFQSVRIPRRLDEVDEEQLDRIYYDRLLRLASSSSSSSYSSSASDSYTGASSALSAEVARSDDKSDHEVSSTASLRHAITVLDGDGDVSTNDGSIEGDAAPAVFDRQCRRSTSRQSGNSSASTEAASIRQVSAQAMASDTRSPLRYPEHLDAVSSARSASGHEPGTPSTPQHPCKVPYSAAPAGSEQRVVPVAAPHNHSATEDSDTIVRSTSKSAETPEAASVERVHLRCARKAWKKQVKEQNRIRRQNKIPKHVKRQAVHRPGRLRRYLAARETAARTQQASSGEC
jgi:serine/threonine-protein kinase RIO1